MKYFHINFLFFCYTSLFLKSEVYRNFLHVLIFYCIFILPDKNILYTHIYRSDALIKNIGKLS